MAKYKLKNNEIEAMRVPGPDSIKVVGKAGEQTAAQGDYIVFWGATAHEREVIHATKFNEMYELVDSSQKAEASSSVETDYQRVLALLTGIKTADTLVGPETVQDESAVAAMASGNEKPHEQVTSSVAPLEPEKATGDGDDKRTVGTGEDKTSGDEKDAGDWTTKGDGTDYPKK